MSFLTRYYQNYATLFLLTPHPIYTMSVILLRYAHFHSILLLLLLEMQVSSVDDFTVDDVRAFDFTVILRWYKFLGV